VRELGDQELERMISDAFRAGYERAVADFKLSCSAVDRDRRKRRWVRLVLAVLGLGPPQG
jgi:hypothetical protein